MACENALSINKIHKDLKSMYKDKMPSYDGLPMEFFLTFWDFLKEDILKMFKEVVL